MNKSIKGKWLILLIYMTLMNHMQGQNIKVEYIGVVNDQSDMYGYVFAFTGTLYTSKEDSWFVETAKDTILILDNGQELDFGGVDFQYVFYKNLDEKEIYYQDFMMGGKKVTIKDNTFPIEWKSGGKGEQVLGYKTMEAIGEFRGRNYKVLYSPDIPINNGPYKFDGLPGLILKVQSDDDMVSFEAKSIEFKTNASELSNPFSDEKSISWEAYRQQYKKWFKRTETFGDSRKDVKVYHPKRYIEVLIAD